MLNKVVKEKYYCGLDIGSRSIKAGILKIRGISDIELMGVYEQKTYGYQNNTVNDLDELSECVSTTIQQLTQKTGIKVKEVQIGLSGAMVAMRETETVIPLIDRGSKVITHRDIKKVNDHARLLGVQMEEEILHDIPQQYKVDDMDSVTNPLGLYGRKLGVRSLMVVVHDNFMRNIVKAVHQAGFEVGNVFFNSYAASQVLLQDRERKDGCVLVDIGSRYTTILVFRNGELHTFRGLHSGGEQLTQKIAYHLNLPVDLAEEIKKSYAAVSGFEQHQDEEILVKKEDAYVPIKRKMIYDAVQPEVEAMVQYISQVISQSGVDENSKSNITFIGGGALLPGLIDQIGQSTRVPVRLGKLSLILEKTLSYTALFSSVVGLAQNGYKKTFRYTLKTGQHEHWAKNISNRFKELYQEYF